MTESRTAPTPGAPILSTARMLFALVGGPIAWALHFLGSYVLVSIGCVAGWRGLREMVAALTVALAGVAIWSMVVAWRGWRGAGGDRPLDIGLIEPGEWFAFLMLIGVLLGAVSGLTIFVQGFGSVVLPECGWNVR